MERIAETSELASPRRGMLSRMDQSVQEHSAQWISALLLTGFAVRVWRASGTFLNSDEVMHVQAANQPSWGLAYRASLTLAHPPLLVLLLHAWRWLGTSELFLRLPSVIAGTAFCWLVYKWAAMLLRPAAAWMAFILALFLPSTIELSGEVRQYALMLAFAMASAYLLELALETDSAAAMLGCGASLWLALGFHYSASLFAAALGTYALVRMAARRPARKVVALWAAGQSVALGLGGFFYVTHLARINSGEAGTNQVYEWISAYLPNSYFVPGKMNPLMFISARSGGVFQYAFGQAAAGDAAYLLFVVGIIFVYRGVFRRRVDSPVTPLQLSLLLILPFAVNCAAALAAAYPYGGTRHSAFLLPFALAGSVLALAHVLNYRTGPAIALALVVALFCNVLASHRQPYISRPNQSIVHLQDALEFIHNQIPSEDWIFADREGGVMLKYYLCEQQPVVMNLSVQGFRSYECGGHRVIMPGATKEFIFTPRSFYLEWQDLVSAEPLAPGTRVWVAQMGWNARLSTQLAELPDLHVVPHAFGQNIQFFDLTVGQAMPDPKLLPTS